MFNQHFDGYLTEEEIARLHNANFSDKEIRIIQDFVYKNRDVLTGFKDLVGDTLVPSKMMILNIKLIGNALSKDTFLTKEELDFRKKTFYKLFKTFGKYFLKTKQVFENRNELMYGTVDGPFEHEINVPNEPVIWAPNHHFKDDAIGTVLAAKRHAVLLFGSVPLLYNSFDGILTYGDGAIVINRKSKASKESSIPKIKNVLNNGTDILWWDEGVHNKTANELILPLWKGIYQISHDTGTKIIPVIHYIFDPTCKLVPKKDNPIHTVIADLIDMSSFDEKEGLRYLRDIMATWYYLMMEKYGKISREDLIKFYEKRAKFYGVNEQELKSRPLAFEEIGALYGLDLYEDVLYYDSSIETTSDYRDKSIVRPEDAFKDISNIKPKNEIVASEVEYAKKLARIRKNEDLQRKF